MKKILFSRGEFATSAFDVHQFPELFLPEIAIAGRSNVGKSTLINHLLNTKLAKTSSIPGKTQSINFYKIDEQVALVDLPGYGYAKVSKPIKDKWSGVIDYYLQERKELKLILLLIDSRRELTKEDHAFAKWAAFHKKQVMFIFTKSDKISETQIQKRMQTDSENLQEMFSPIHIVIPKSANGNIGTSDLQQAQTLAKKGLCEHKFDAASCKDEDADEASGQLLNHDVYKSVFFLSYSIKQPHARIDLIKHINGILNGSY